MSLDLDGNGPMAPIVDKVLVRCRHGKAPVRSSSPDDGIAMVNALEAGLNADDCTTPDGVGVIGGSLEARGQSEADGFSLQVHFGRSLLADGVIGHGFLMMHGERPTPALFDAKNVRYIHPLNLSLEISAGRKVAQLCLPDNERVRYHFADGTDATATAEQRDHQRLRFLWLDRTTEANGTKGYRLRTPEGSYIRFVAVDTDTRRIYRPEELVTAAGRHFSLSDKTICPAVTRTADGSRVEFGNGYAAIVSPLNAPAVGFTISCGTNGSVWKVENLSADPLRFETVQITHQRPGIETETTNYAYNWDTHCWVVTSIPGVAGGVPRIVQTKLEKGKRTIDVAGVTRRTDRTFTRQEGYDDQLDSATVDPAGANLKTQFEYGIFKTDILDGVKVERKLPKSATLPSTAKIETFYDEDGPGYGRVTRVTLPWRDANGGRTVEYSYAAIPGENDVMEDPDNAEVAPNDIRPRMITERVGNSVISRSWFVYKKDDDGNLVTIAEKAGLPDAAFGDAKNIRSTVVLNGPGTLPMRLCGMLKSFSSSDGYHTTSSSELLPDDAIQITTESRLLATPGGTVEAPRITGKSQRTVTLVNANGRPASETLQVWQGEDEDGTDIWEGCGTVTYNYDGATGRLTGTSRSNNTAEATTWTLYAVDTVTGPDGIQTCYVYNRYRELESSTRDGKTTTFTHDQAGGTTGSTVTGGTQSQSASSTLDGAGRLKTIVAPNQSSLTIDYNVPASTVTVTPSGKDGTRTTKLWLDGRTKSVSGTGIPSMYIDYGVEAGGLWTKVWADTDTEPGNGNYPWTRTGFDFRGRLWKTSVSANNNSYIETESGYDDYGRPEKEITRAGNVVKPTALIVYDSAGLPWRAGIDMNNNGTLDPNTTDRFVQTDATINNGSKLVVSSFYPGATGGPLAAPGGTGAHFTNPGAIAPVQISTRRERLTGFAPGVTSEVETTDINGKTTSETTEISNGHVIRRTTVPDSTLPIVEDYRDGRLLSRTDQFGHTTTYAYDGLGRLTGTTDARGNTTTTTYNSKGQVESETDATWHLTTYAYDPETGRVIRVTDPRNGTVNYDYDPHGNVTRTWGSATYPTETGYDTLNRRISLKTFRGGTAGDGINWPAEPGTPDTTSWTYDGSSGLLTRKSYPNGGSVNYSYDGFNRMTGRAWARGINTTYAYNELDQLTTVAYSDGTTPGIGYTYNGFGQRASVTDAAGTRAFSYNSKFQQIAESITGLYAKAIGRTYDDFGRVSGTTIAADSYSVGHGYDATGRLTSLTGNGDSWAFSYLANTNLLSQISGPHGITVNGTYEPQRDLLTRRENKVGETIISAFNHTNDELGRRITAVRSGSAFTQAETLSFGYNSRSELTSAVSSLVQQNNWNHLFTYDNIGNRLTATKGQANPLTTTYQTGPANVYDKVKEGSQQEASLAYDDDGNMLGSNDGWAYQWDGENRLVRASRTVIDPVTHVQTVTVVGCVYDYMSRRVEKTVTINGAITKKLRFVYDGYQLIQELNGQIGRAHV